MLTFGSLALSAPITAQAHIGWTKEQVSAYYANAEEPQWIGPGSLPDAAEISFSCKVNNVWVWLSFLKGKVAEIHYMTLPSRPILPAEIEALLEKNGTSVKTICPPNAEERVKLAWKVNSGLRDYLDSTDPRWEHLIDRTVKEIVSMETNKAEDWRQGLDWTPTAGVLLLQIQTYEYFTINAAVHAAWAAKNAAAQAAAEKSTEGL
jgi:hypothetical protein